MKLLLAQWLSNEQVHGVAHASASPLRDYAIHLLSQFDGEPHGIRAAQKKFPGR
jgi:hypothetical protein